MTQLIYRKKKMEVSLLSARFKDVMFAQVVAALAGDGRNVGETPETTKGVFLVTTSNTFIPVNRVFSVNTDS